MRTLSRLLAGLGLIGSLMHAASAAEVGLKSISASYPLLLDAHASGSQSFPIADAQRVYLKVLLPQDAVFVVRTPAGAELQNTSTPSSQFTFVDGKAMEDALLPKEQFWLVDLGVVTPGTYEIQALSGSLSQTATLVTVQYVGSAIKSALIAGDPNQALTVAQPTAVAVALFENGAPLANAEVAADLVNEAGAVQATVALRDDGVGADQTGGDGLYTGSMLPPTEGAHVLRSRVQGKTEAGHAFEANDVHLVYVNPPNVRLLGQVAEQVIDSDGDGLYDFLELSFPHRGQFGAGPYALHVVLGDGAKTVLDAFGGTDPSGTLTVRVPAQKLRELPLDGPYQLDTVVLSENGTFLQRLDDLGPVATYPRSAWDRVNALILPGVSDVAHDSDGDGLYDRLDVTLTVDVQRAGYYGVSVDLRSRDGVLLGTKGWAAAYLRAGPSTLTGAFAGDQIGAARRDGPYEVGNLLLYPTYGGSAPAFAEHVGQTKPYACQQFVGCKANLTALLDELRARVAGVPMPPGIRVVLGHRTDQIQAAAEAERWSEALEELDKLIKFVGNLKGNSLSDASADQLLQAAADVRAALDESRR
jgi:hypothetical protein